jgi:hypothetical protein
MWKLFETHMIPRIKSGETMHLNGTFTKKIYDYIRELYRDFGFFEASDNRFYVPSTAQITLGIRMTDLNYQPQSHAGIYLSQ